MTTEVNRGLAARLRRLPGQLLLALVNGTVVLVIAACVLVLIAAAKLEGLASNVAVTMTDAILARIDVDPRNALAELQQLAADIRGAAAALKDAKAAAKADLTARIDRLESRLDSVVTNLGRLNDGRSLLVEEALARIARTLADDLEKLRGCRPPAPDV